MEYLRERDARKHIKVGQRACPRGVRRFIPLTEKHIREYSLHGQFVCTKECGRLALHLHVAARSRVSIWNTR